MRAEVMEARDYGEENQVRQSWSLKLDWRMHWTNKAVNFVLTTLDCPISVGHSISAESVLIFNVDQISSFKLVWATVFLQNPCWFSTSTKSLVSN